MTRDGLVGVPPWCESRACRSARSPNHTDAPLDVVAQQIVAICAAAGPEGVDEGELLALLRAWPFRTLGDGDYAALLLLLTEGWRRGEADRRPTCTGIASTDACGRRGARLFAVQKRWLTIPVSNDFEVVLEGEEIVVRATR